MKNIFKKITFPLTIFILFGIIISLLNRLIYIISSFHDKTSISNSYYYQWKFGKIFYTVKGEGKPILLIHSLKNGASSYEYNKIYKKLSKKYKVYLIDLIGYGRSEKPKITYTAYLYLQLISDFISNVIKEPCDIVTSGKSNAFVTMLAVQDTSIIKNIIFINPPYIYDLAKNPKTKEKILKYILETPLIGTLLFNILSSKFVIRKQFKSKYLYNMRKTYYKFIDAFYESSHLGYANNKYSFSSNICKYNNVNILNSLKIINNSIYIVQGGNRLLETDKLIDEYKKVNSSIEFSIINNTNEFPHIEKPDSVLQLLFIYLHQ